VRGGLATVEWRTRREILRALVRRVELDRRQVTICRVPPPFTAPGPDGSVLPDCRRRAQCPRKYGTSSSVIIPSLPGLPWF
jgi:hypothetical protein